MIKDYVIVDNIIYGGCFGNILKCKKKEKFYIIKYGESDNIKYEANIYNLLRNVNNVSSLYDYFYIKNNDYFEKVSHIYISLINIIKDIHNIGLIHRDLKPTNICLNNIYEPVIIDFGMAKMYIVSKKHILERKLTAIIGSYSFCSLNVINLKEPSRRDDMESLLYIFLYMILINYDIFNKISSTIKDILKLHNILSLLDNQKINHDYIIKSLTYIRKLKFNQEPNYNLLIDYSKKIFNII